MCIDILESLPSFCPKVVVAFRGIESYASKLLVMLVNIMTMMTMIQMTIMMMMVILTMMIYMDLILFGAHKEELVATLAPGCLHMCCLKTMSIRFL